MPNPDPNFSAPHAGKLMVECKCPVAQVLTQFFTRVIATSLRKWSQLLAPQKNTHQLSLEPHNSVQSNINATLPNGGGSEFRQPPGTSLSPLNFTILSRTLFTRAVHSRIIRALSYYKFSWAGQQGLNC